MSDLDRPEYVTDVPYVRTFENDLSPSRLRLVAALNGFAPPPPTRFDYCELGSAHGDTTVALAAAYPEGRFVGVDLNPDHIASANRLVARGSLDNVRFLLRDFEDLDRENLPTFDFIAAHGVLSWVGPSKRDALIKFAAAHLKPGGLLYVSYNALPGWAAVEPLRQLLVGRATLGGGDSLARAKSGLELAKQLSALGAEYFTSNPAARAMLARMEQLGLAYVAHEYLHAHWVPMYFANVASEMASSDLYFVGQLPLYLNYRDVSVPQPLAPVFAGVTDRVAFESLKDFALNEYFRRDVYTKGRGGRSDAATREYLDLTLLGGPLGGGAIPRTAKFPHHTLHYAGPIFDAILAAIQEATVTVKVLASRPELSGFGLGRIRDAVLSLLLGEVIVPMVETTGVSSAAPNARYRVPSTYNRVTLREGLSTETPVTLASTAAGTGLEVSSVEAVAVHLLTEVAPDDREGWVRARCRRESFRLAVRGRVIEDREEQVKTLLDELDRFCQTRLPKWVELGVLAKE